MHKAAPGVIAISSPARFAKLPRVTTSKQKLYGLRLDMRQRSDLQPYGADPRNTVSVRRRLDDFRRACRKGHLMLVAVVKSYDFGKTSAGTLLKNKAVNGLGR